MNYMSCILIKILLVDFQQVTIGHHPSIILTTVWGDFFLMAHGPIMAKPTPAMFVLFVLFNFLMIFLILLLALSIMHLKIIMFSGM